MYYTSLNILTCVSTIAGCTAYSDAAAQVLHA